MRLHVNCACGIGTSLNLDLLCVAENGVVLELCRTAASQNCHSCQFADIWAERGYYDESDVVLCVNISSVTALVYKLCQSRVLYEREESQKDDDEIQLFRQSVSQLPRTQRYVHKYHSLCMLGLGFVASLAIIRVIHNYGKFKISVAIPKQRTLPHSLITLVSVYNHA